MVDLQKMLREVANRGLAYADECQVVALAHALWHEGFTPDLDSLSTAAQHEAGYLVDRLARFNVLTAERKATLLDLVSRYHPRTVYPITGDRDPLAEEWGASADLSAFMCSLLPLQTRQYAFDIRQKAKRHEKLVT